MRAHNPIETLAEAVYSAIAKDLPDVEYLSSYHGEGQEDKPSKRRPRAEDLKIYHFPQTWGSTALGFGGMGGAAMTTAFTTVVISKFTAAIYFDGRHAYTVENFNQNLRIDLSKFAIKSYKESKHYIG